MITPPRLAFACPQPWATMSGLERLKCCEQCGHHVANLSLMSAAERTATLKRAETERVCGSYLVRLSGEMVTPEHPLTPRERLNIRQAGVMALSAAALAVATGCVSTPIAHDPGTESPTAAPASSPATPKVPAHDAQIPPTTPSVAAGKEPEIILLDGFIVCTPPKPHKPPSRRGK